jgi:ABC-type branched-subunit amino acid transport system substrate-binding protein
LHASSHELSRVALSMPRALHAGRLPVGMFVLKTIWPLFVTCLSEAPASPLAIGVYGPMTSVDIRHAIAAVAFDIDFRKNFDADLRARFGPPVVTVANLSGDLRIQTLIGNSNSKISDGVETVVKMMNGRFLDAGEPSSLSFIGIVGGYHSAISIPVAGLTAALSTVQISYASTNSVLSNKEEYPYFLRTIAPDNVVINGLVAFVRFFQLRRLACLHTSEAYGQGANDLLFATLAEGGMASILTSVSLSGRSFGLEALTLTDLDGPIQILRSSKASVVFLVFATDQSQFHIDALGRRGSFFEALQHHDGLKSIDFQYISAPGGTAELEGDCMQGSLAWHYEVSRNPKFLDFWRNLTADDVLMNSTRYGFHAWPATAPFNSSLVRNTDIHATLSSYTFTLFDACYAFVHAASALLNAGVPADKIKGKTLLDAVKDVKFNGASGAVVFVKNGDRAVPL